MAVKCPKCQTDNPDTQKFCGECATPLHLAKDVSVTKTLETPVEILTRGTFFADRYEIIEELGSGGMGKVYRVEDKKIGEEVALKLIKPEISADKKTIERFRNELKIARKIRHKNVCGMYDLGEEKGIHYITMEYVRGEDLKDSIRRFSKLPIGKSIEIAIHICEGLAEAHRLGVVHRDLKPSNIMIDKSGNARIMDFGIARSLESKGITGVQVMIGTPEYISPEQVETKKVDQRSDIYSLGVILYEMMTGRLPFEGETPLSVAIKHKSELPPNPNDFNKQIPDALNNLILKCLEKDAEKRFQNIAELQAELVRLEEGLPTKERLISKRKPLTSKEITLTLGLRKNIFPVFILILALFVILFVWHPWSKEKIDSIQSGKPSLAILYFKNNTGDNNLDIWKRALAESLITDMSQSKYINVLPAERLYSVNKKLGLLESDNYSSEDLIRITEEGHVDHILLGNYSRAGNNFRIEFTLKNMNTGEAITSERVEGEGENSFFSMTDELTLRIKRALKFSEEIIGADLDKSIAEATTGSPEAFKFYTEGLTLALKGEIQNSIQFYEKALSADPNFAMAYRALGNAYRFLGIFSLANQNLSKAFELSDKVTLRERYIIQGEYYGFLENNQKKARDAYQSLLQVYPNDLIGTIKLGAMYSYLEEWDKSIELLELSIEQDIDAFHPYFYVATSYAGKGWYEKAKDTLNYYLTNKSDNTRVRRQLIDIYLFSGDYQQALIDIEKLYPSDSESLLPQNEIKAAIYTFREEIDKAEKELQNLLDSRNNQEYFRGIIGLSNLHLLLGKYESAIALIDQGIRKAKELKIGFLEPMLQLSLANCLFRYGKDQEALQACTKLEQLLQNLDDKASLIDVVYLKGTILTGFNLIDEAQIEANRLRDILEEDLNQKLMRYYFDLQGKIEYAKNDFPMAKDNFEKALSLLSHEHSFDGDQGLFYDSSASAFYRMGDLDKAISLYKELIKLTTGRLLFGDIYAKSFYILGKIYEQQDDTTRAIEHYEKFLSLWKDADPGSAEVEDARQRVAGLLAP